MKVNMELNGEILIFIIEILFIRFFLILYTFFKYIIVKFN